MVPNVCEENASSMFAVKVSKFGKKKCIYMRRDEVSHPISSLLHVCSKMVAI
jgi:hypothetical protein